MQVLPKILTSRSNNQSNLWKTNTVNIHEYFPINNKWMIIKKIQLKIFRKLIKYDFFVAVRLFFYRKKFDVIISRNTRIAAIYSFLCFFSSGCNIHILHEFFLKKPTKLKQKIKLFLLKLFLKNVDYIRVNSFKEQIYYSQLLNFPVKKFWFLAIPSKILNPKFIKEDNKYVFSAGKASRDYLTLIKAIKGTGIKLIIVSDFKSLKKVEIPDEIEVYYNIDKNIYLSLLKKSRIVVIPLSNEFISCGQVTFLEAMSYGKPVIVTNTTASIDYISNFKTGLLYKLNDYKDLRNKINLLFYNDDLRNNIAKNALRDIKIRFNCDVFEKNYINFLKLCNR